MIYIFHNTFVGSNVQRVKTSIRTIGPAVANGGMTTFLSVVMLSGSHSYILKAFWKIFFFTVVFGQFQGLVLLPVILCYLGPCEKPTDAGKSKESGKTNDAQEIDTVTSKESGIINDALEIDATVHV